MLTKDQKQRIRKLETEFYESAGIFLKNMEENEDAGQKPGFLKEYRRLVERAGRHLPPLWESCYVSGTRALCDRSTLAVLKEYKKAGICLKSRKGQALPDDVGMECLYVSYLLFLIEETENKKAGSLLKEFLRVHLGRLVEGLQKELGQEGENGGYPVFYGIVSRIGEQIRQVFQVLQELEAEGGFKDTPLKQEAFGCGETVKNQASLFSQRFPDWRSLGVDIVPAEPPERITKRGGGCWNNCGSSCLKEVTAEDGCIVKVRSARTEELKEERLTTCLRGQYSAETFLSADRLRYPLLRTGKRGSGEFRRISWEEAVDWMARENKRIKETYGPQSRYVAYSTGIVSEVRPDKIIRRFLNLDGGFLDFYNDYSAACINFSSELMYGTCETGNSVEDLINANLILIWGHNPLETGFGPMMRKALARAKKKGIRITAIDPRCSDTAAYVDEWIPIRPGTDGAMAAAMAYVILSEKLHDITFLHRYCSGFDKETMPEAYRDQETFEEYIFGKRDGVKKTPEWAEKITGVPAEKTTALARAYAAAKPGAILQGCGPQRQENGEQTSRMIAVLSCLCGYVGISGGRCGAVDAVAQYPHAEFPQGENPYPGRIPCYLWTKAVLEGTRMEPVRDGLLGADHLESNIKMIWCLGGNTLLNQHGDIAATRRILMDETLCECIVCSDLFLTPSAMYADLVLPGASCYEVENLTRAWQEGDFLLYNQKYREPIFESRYEYDWIYELARRSGVGEEFSEGHKTVGDWCRSLYDKLREEMKGTLVSYEELKGQGIAWYEKRDPVIAFERQIQNPKQVPFDTYSGKIELFSPYLYHLYEEKEIAAIPKYQPALNGYETLTKDGKHFQLIGWHTKVRTHSCHDNNVTLQKKEPQAVWMHPKDAERLGIKEGNKVCLSNDRGCMEVPVKITGRIAEGVLALSQGAWYSPDKQGVDTAGSINVLTSLTPTPAAKGNPQHTITVKITGIAKEG